MSWVYLVICLAVLVYLGTAFNAGRVRHKLGILAPTMAGPPEFERAMRIQQNTLEQIVPFLPMLWLFAQLVHPRWAAALGLVWVVGRALYAVSYQRDANKRGPGFLIAFAALVVLWAGTVIAASLSIIGGA